MKGGPRSMKTKNGQLMFLGGSFGLAFILFTSTGAAEFMEPLFHFLGF
jgi:hypothetical protein